MSYNKCIYHIVFRTRASKRVISENHERELYFHFLDYCRKRGCHLYRVGGMPDHVHLLVTIPPHIAVADFVKGIKLSSHKFMELHREYFPMFEAWGTSYCCLSYSSSEVPIIVNYIKNQKEHHRKVGFMEELLALLKENGVEYNPAYLNRDWE